MWSSAPAEVKGFPLKVCLTIDVSPCVADVCRHFPV